MRLPAFSRFRDWEKIAQTDVRDGSFITAVRYIMLNRENNRYPIDCAAVTTVCNNCYERSKKKKKNARVSAASFTPTNTARISAFLTDKRDIVLRGVLITDKRPSTSKHWLSRIRDEKRSIVFFELTFCRMTKSRTLKCLKNALCKRNKAEQLKILLKIFCRSNVYHIARFEFPASIRLWLRTKLQFLRGFE